MTNIKSIPYARAPKQVKEILHIAALKYNYTPEDLLTGHSKPWFQGSAHFRMARMVVMCNIYNWGRHASPIKDWPGTVQIAEWFSMTRQNAWRILHQGGKDPEEITPNWLPKLSKPAVGKDKEGNDYDLELRI